MLHTYIYIYKGDLEFEFPPEYWYPDISCYSSQQLQAVNQDRCRTIHDLCAEVGIGYGSCQRILTEQLNMHRIAAKFVPRVLTQDQKDSRVVICQELKGTVINDPTFLLNVITGD